MPIWRSWLWQRSQLALSRTRIAIVPGNKHATVRGPAALAFYETEGLAP